MVLFVTITIANVRFYWAVVLYTQSLPMNFLFSCLVPGGSWSFQMFPARSRQVQLVPGGSSSFLVLVCTIKRNKNGLIRLLSVKDSIRKIRKIILEKDKFNLKVYDVQPGEQTIAIHLFTNISRSKCNQAIKFGLLIEFNMRSIFLEKSYTKCGGETIPRPCSEKSKLSISLDQYLKSYIVCFYCIPSWELSEYIETKLEITCFYLI